MDRRARAAGRPLGLLPRTGHRAGRTSTIATLPVLLAVWDFTLPSTATLRSGFGLDWNSMCVQAYGSDLACDAYPGSGGSVDTAIELTTSTGHDVPRPPREPRHRGLRARHRRRLHPFRRHLRPVLRGTAPTLLPGASSPASGTPATTLTPRRCRAGAITSPPSPGCERAQPLPTTATSAL